MKYSTKSLRPLTPADCHTGCEASDGKIVVLIMAGGQGTRLGFSGPKGMYPLPIGGVEKTLFQLHAENITTPLVVMTAPHNHRQTTRYFSDHNNFGLDVHFFSQRELPLLDEDGFSIGQPAPNGNGDAVRGDILSQLDYDFLYIVPIENLLALPVDLELVGLAQKYGVSCLAVSRQEGEKAGVFACGERGIEIVEYFELEEETADSLSNPGIYCFSKEFVISARDIDLPIHLSQKKWQGRQVQKQETFIFDLFVHAPEVALLYRNRDDCFMPLKNSVTDVEKFLQNPYNYRVNRGC